MTEGNAKPESSDGKRLTTHMSRTRLPQSPLTEKT
jgi:hypothetical protein